MSFWIGKILFLLRKKINSVHYFYIVNSLRSDVQYLFQQKHRTMIQQGTTLAVKSILFESNDPEVLIKGTMSKGVMKYETDLVVTHSQLNIIFNNLQKYNQEISLNEFLISEKMHNNETLYSADFSSLQFNNIMLSDIEGGRSLKLIRA